MDFDFNQNQNDIRALAAKILGDFTAPEKLPDIEAPVEWYDDALWQALATAGLLGVAIPEQYGGMGLGIFELGILLEQVGRTVAPVPAWSALAVAAEAVREFGSDEQRRRLLPGVADGSLVLAAALEEIDSRDPRRPATVAVATRAARVLVAASVGADGVGLFLLDPRSPGVRAEAQQVTTGEQRWQLRLDGARVDAADVLVVGGEGAAALGWVLARALAGLCAMELGVAARALEMTGKYVSEREQFGKAIGTFQAVGQRAADAWIDVEAVRLSTWSALWRLAEGRDATRELEIAKFWAAEGGHRACYAAQHLHGGIGVDTDYPLHRYYLLSRQIELTLGGAKTQLAARGAALAS
jgi:alkylation response protein AidB-like acyl-CoA dehydrogenase